MPEGQCKDNTFHYRCKGKCPPDTIKAHSHMSQQHGKRNSGTGQDNADGRESRRIHEKKCRKGSEKNERNIALPRLHIRHHVHTGFPIRYLFIQQQIFNNKNVMIKFILIFFFSFE